MKLDKRKCTFKVWNNRFYLLPTIVIDFDDVMFMEKNFSIEFHWICFHARLMWFEH